MASAFTHAFAAASLGVAITPGRVVPRLLVLGIACSILPDIDVVGLRFGLPYDALLGHRGLSHSLASALMIALLATPLVFSAPRFRGSRLRIGVYVFVVTASHGVFDAMTNGGLGVAFFSPFDETRYFLPFRPVEVSPIGIRAFFTARPLAVIASEMIWIVIPWTLLALLVRCSLGRYERGAPSGGPRSEGDRFA